MRPIRKGPEPASLTTYRVRGDATYEGYREKDELREALVREQRGICCYCGGRIRAALGGMKIEHWHSRSAFPGEQLTYRNLLGACMGGDGPNNSRQHCDTWKGDKELSRNPADRAHWPGIDVEFTSRGEILAKSEPLNSELSTVLNLNLAELKSKRKAMLDGFKRASEMRGGFSRDQLERRLREWNGDDGVDDLKPYCQVVVHWLRKRLARD